MTAEASNSLDFTSLTPGMDVEQVFGMRKSTLMPMVDDEVDDSPVAPIRESTVSLHGLGNSAEFSRNNEGTAVGVGDSVLKAADAGHADAAGTMMICVYHCKILALNLPLGIQRSGCISNMRLVWHQECDMTKTDVFSSPKTIKIPVGCRRIS